MIDRELYTKRLETILKTIRDIENDSSISKAVKSYKIMKLLRNECVFVSKEYLAAANHKDYTTLDPNNEGIRNIIPEDDFVIDWYPIFANSFGPFNPKAYFESTIKVLWLLKEPFIKKESWVKGDRGGHDQAKENRHWNNIENDTIRNIIKLSSFMLAEISGTTSQNDISEVTLQAKMNHICILEVNHFPGLAFKSTNTEDTKNDKGLLLWARYNRNLLKYLIEFYEADVIIGCYSFMGEFASNKHLLNYLAIKENSEKPFLNGEQWEYVIHNQPIQKMIFDHQIIRPWAQDDTCKTNKHSMVKTTDNRYWINAYHPAPINNSKNQKNLIKFAQDFKSD